MAKGGKGILGLPRIISFILCLFFIFPVIERFLRGKILQGLLYLLTGGYFGIGYIIDLVLIIVKNDLLIF